VGQKIETNELLHWVHRESGQGDHSAQGLQQAVLGRSSHSHQVSCVGCSGSWDLSSAYIPCLVLASLSPSPRSFHSTSLLSPPVSHPYLGIPSDRHPIAISISLPTINLQLAQNARNTIHYRIEHVSHRLSQVRCQSHGRKDLWILRRYVPSMKSEVGSMLNGGGSDATCTECHRVCQAGMTLSKKARRSRNSAALVE